jgi:hypothetical protein
MRFYEDNINFLFGFPIKQAKNEVAETIDLHSPAGFHEWIYYGDCGKSSSG